jgi:hypothetical protein
MSDIERARLEAGADVSPIIPRTVEEVGRVADAIMHAGMVPKSYEGPNDKATKAKLMIGIMKGLEVGFGPITALSTICIIGNRPCVWGDGAVALCDRGGAVEWVKHGFEGDEGKDDWTAFYQIKRRSHEEPYEARFSVKDAKRAHLWANPKRVPWIEYPQRMLLARARAFALREGFADFLMGLSIVEEAQDLPPEPAPIVDKSFLDDRPALSGPTEQPLGMGAPEPETVPVGETDASV